MRLAIVNVVVLLLLSVSALASDPRVIFGSLIHRERIALPPETEMLVELRDSAGTVLATAREPTGGAQVPLPFTIEAPSDLPLSLQAALRIGGAIGWLSEPIAIEAGQGPVDLGEILLRRHRPMGFSSMLSCGELIVELAFAGQNARLRIGAAYLDLEPERTASGSRFVSPVDPGTWVWTHRDAATLSLEGVEMPECRQLLPETRYTARGNEPGWSVVFEGGQMRYRGDYGATEVTVAQPEPQIVDGARRYAAEGVELAVSLATELCRDAMTGMPYPDRAVVEIDGRELRGCGGDPRDLLSAHPWRVEDIAGGGVIDASEVVLRFGREGRVGGRGGCNAFTAAYELGGEGLSISQPASTMMACPEALMMQERRFFDALALVSRFDLSSDGELRLMAGADTVLTARR